MHKAPIHYTAQHKATAVHNGKYVPGGEREGAQTWNFMNHISLSFVRMQMPTHKLTVQVLDNTYRQYIRQYSTRGKFRPVYLCLSNLRLLLKSSVLSAINLQYCMQDFFCPIPYRHRTRNSDSCFATATYCTLLTVFLH